jgi:hypothetical protein
MLRRSFSIGAAVVVGALSVLALAVSGGVGALITAAVVTAGVCAWAARRRASPRPWPLAIGVVAVLVGWNSVSFTSYVLRDNGLPAAEKAATWGRDHGLGHVIDRLEAWRYSTPPAAEPARELTLTPALPPVPTTQPPVQVDAPTTTSTPQENTATTIDPAPAAPAPLTPVFAPPLQGEGQWVPISRAGGYDSMWATSIRPLSSAGGVVATVVMIDQTYTRAALFNGSEEPGGTWARGSRVPPALYSSLLATMNGGFRFEHIKGGYVTEGVVVKPLRQGDATLAVGRDGKLVLGQLGRDIIDDGTWVSLRQNLILIVDGGRSQVQRGIQEGVWWGADYGREVYVPRSAVCTMADGRLAYALVGKVDAEQLAQSLIAIGCVKAMQLDINGTWPSFATYEQKPGGRPVGHLVDTRMGNHATRYLDGSTKEYFAFFDAALVPPQSVLDR